MPSSVSTEQAGVSTGVSLPAREIFLQTHYSFSAKTNDAESDWVSSHCCSWADISHTQKVDQTSLSCWSSSLAPLGSALTLHLILGGRRETNSGFAVHSEEEEGWRQITSHTPWQSCLEQIWRWCKDKNLLNLKDVWFGLNKTCPLLFHLLAGVCVCCQLWEVALQTNSRSLKSRAVNCTKLHLVASLSLDSCWAVL